MFTKNVTHQTIDRFLPYLGFGEADRVNLAMAILAKDMTASDFEKHYKNLEYRVSREVGMVFDQKKYSRTIEDFYLMQNLSSYDFSGGDHNLQAHSLKQQNEWASKAQKKYTESYSYDVEVLSTEEMQEDLESFTKANIFFKQQQFLNAYIEFDKIKQKQKFSSLSAGMSYSFYMAYKENSKDLNFYIEK
jgi:hypothetical protein